MYIDSRRIVKTFLVVSVYSRRIKGSSVSAIRACEEKTENAINILNP